MKYRVLHYFTDLQDNEHPYHAGDTFPREGLSVDTNRIKELSTNANLRGIALIEEVRGAEETPAAEETDDKSAPVENEPRKRTRKRKTEE
jgi:hypothetical protein